ncbi:CAP domain-containing protein [Streptomyces gibsoniae]|uniref:CAP domain-containing protein n=1 Tax=Streptomyces gibsoniae TaxID=3075529 RepID=A0ABU2TSP5_9ACTN|nr:CAP domain-containing protein [Streptomyces sp. DSM 41699]MDT0463986.1 CAP domain-containing protein [Streptomyces sp. DSM 41699]
MGRHRRSAAGRAATGRATQVTQNHQPSTERYGPENLYGFAEVLEAERQATRSRRKKKAPTPVRTGLLGVSAAVALGTVAVATGVLPGGKSFTVSGDAGDVQASGTSPTGYAHEQGGTSGTADGRGSTSTSRDHERGSATSPAVTPSAPVSSTAPTQEPSQSQSPSPAATQTATTAPPAKKHEKKPKTHVPAQRSAATSTAVAVLDLVNQERAKAGCTPVTASNELTKLAQAFSDDMATRNFFDHTDPDGKDPWDRAAVLGITDLGGENIARGQTTAQDVMDAWMNSPGHRANILNCDFKTLGVGVHLGTGGPWWTQDFGY